jgi:hypothetical protein
MASALKMIGVAAFGAFLAVFSGLSTMSQVKSAAGEVCNTVVQLVRSAW